MLPPVADHVTEVLVDPLTLAVNCCVWPAGMEVDPGDTLTVTAGAVSVADLFDNVQPAKDKAMRETIATMQSFARNCWGGRCLGRAMLVPLFISSRS